MVTEKPAPCLYTARTNSLYSRKFHLHFSSQQLTGWGYEAAEIWALPCLLAV